jgi:hypothetical protein
MSIDNADVDSLNSDTYLICVIDKQQRLIMLASAVNWAVVTSQASTHWTTEQHNTKAADIFF